MPDAPMARPRLSMPSLLLRRRPSLSTKYRLGRILGTGGCAIVHEAEHRWSGAKVAIKVLTKANAAATAEATLLQSLHHPNIVQCTECIESTDGPCVVLELLAGGDLFSRYQHQRRFSEDDVRHVVYGVLSALAYCHARSLVHRDIKLENILFDKHDNVKLADFGLATYATSALSRACGTIGFLAPEVAHAQPYGTPIDIWATGIVMFTLLFDRLPFGTSFETLHSLTDASTVPYPPHKTEWLSANARRVLEAMLTVDPTKRATAADLLLDPWFQAPMPSWLAAPTTAPKKLGFWAKLRPRFMAKAA
ncbi:CAMK protein kinase [Saprolegnia parasitica CBS 223.65]|uniref:CAMK protein kinase n=1 Tax=Saprolegnia parasitica (strain CBS 223.65) TaxID=695850 RepID=A0A067CFL7_SAPPC|nr:CAMK protein kinase [Saprolegnia parasitica CBS 223.65]KDO25341.1 CAMK protein kinase [Saprolegnia parasitica CBS 223.65]|eukprot:XP_012203991.1 CAMK protein kinase [Saprolegnia parasitica CBS 223.65]